MLSSHTGSFLLYLVWELRSPPFYLIKSLCNCTSAAPMSSVPSVKRSTESQGQIDGLSDPLLNGCDMSLPLASLMEAEIDECPPRKFPVDNTARWLKPFLAFILPSLVFCLIVPRRRHLSLPSWVFSRQLVYILHVASLLVKVPLTSLLVLFNKMMAPFIKIYDHISAPVLTNLPPVSRRINSPLACFGRRSLTPPWSLASPSPAITQASGTARVHHTYRAQGLISWAVSILIGLLSNCLCLTQVRRVLDKV